MKKQSLTELEGASGEAAAEAVDDVKEIVGKLMKMKTAIVKIALKGITNPVDVAKLTSYYAKQENLESLTNYLATQLVSQGQMPEGGFTEQEMMKYINKNAGPLMKMGVMHYNQANDSDIKLELFKKQAMTIGKTRLKQIIKEEIEERLVLNEIKQAINEMDLNLTEEERRILEESVLDAIKSAAKKAALPITVVAALAFGSQVASNLYDLEGVGVTPTAAEQISNAVEAGQNMSTKRIDFLEKSIEDSSREGEIPADLAKGVSGDKAKDIAMDRLEKEFAQQGNVVSTGQAQAGSGYLIYVPYDSLPDGYKDTFTGGAEKEDLKKFYQTMDIQDLADKVRDFNSWGSEGHGQFYDSETGGQLLPASWSIAFKALQDKTAERGAKGKNTFK